MSNFFDNLNYTLGNEDTSLEFGILPVGPTHIYAVAGSGSRILPLLAKQPKQLTCVDSSYAQLYLTELRVESLRSLNFEEFLAFWSYPPKSFDGIHRKKVFKNINLSNKSRQFINNLFEKNQWESLLYTGRWEKTFSKLSKINNLFTGAKGRKLFEFEETSNYFNYLKNRFPHKAWEIGLAIFGNAFIFNSLLYKGAFPKKNISESFYRFYSNSFKRIFKQGLARSNFLLQLIFFGKLVYSEGNPIECDPEIFSSAKESLKKVEIKYLHGDFVREAQKTDNPIDFVSFSDVASYFQGDLERNFLQKISQPLSTNCLLVLRYYLHVPEGVNINGFIDVTEKYKDLIEREKIQVYRIKIYQKT